MELAVWLQIFSVLCVAFVHRSAKKRGVDVLSTSANLLVTLMVPVYPVALILMIKTFTALQTWLWTSIAFVSGGAILTSSFVTFVYVTSLHIDQIAEYRIVKIGTLLYVVGSVAMLVKVLLFAEA